MKERPIIFSPMMVRALDRKTKTRRIVNGNAWVEEGDFDYTGQCVKVGEFIDLRRCPYGQPEDRLWVRETWATSRYMDDQPPRETKNHGLPFWYAADDSVRWTGATSGGPGFTTRGKWRPSIHMPRWAIRIVLEITDIRVERLQDISEEDAKAEGAEYPGCAVWADRQTEKNIRGYRLGFLGIWESIHGLGSWDRNDWVWVVSFRRITP